MKKTSTFKRTLLVCVLALTSIMAYAKDRKVKVTVTEPDAKIWVSGKMVGTGSTIVLVESYACVTVIAEKAGFLKYTVEFCNKPGFTPPAANYEIKMERDDAYDASEATDIANVDLEFRSSKTPEESWKLINQIVTGFFDAIESADKETSYLRTAWVAKVFKQSTIRTRVIIKYGSASPLTYKIKLVSEYATGGAVSIKNDELFKEWDRVLRKYKPLVVELQSRLESN